MSNGKPLSCLRVKGIDANDNLFFDLKKPERSPQRAHTAVGPRTAERFSQWGRGLESLEPAREMFAPSFESTSLPESRHHVMRLPLPYHTLDPFALCWKIVLVQADLDDLKLLAPSAWKKGIHLDEKHFGNGIERMDLDLLAAMLDIVDRGPGEPNALGKFILGEPKLEAFTSYQFADGAI